MAVMAQRLLFFKLIVFLVGCMQNYRLLPQDFADSLASHISASVTTVLLAIVMVRMFAFDSIECLTSSEWSESWEKAAEAYCFTTGTYAIPHAAANKTDGTEWDVKLRLDYYYWIPYIFIGQAVILKSPDFFWHYICDLHPKQPIGTLRAFAYLGGSQEVIEEPKDNGEPNKLTNCRLQHTWSERLAEHLMSRNEVVNFESWDLFAIYMLFKILRLAVLLLSLLYLKACFGLDSVLFGITMATNSLRGAPWEETDLFPRSAFCDVHMRHIGQWNNKVTQCALPINLLAEKVLLFLWFWIVGSAVVLLCSTAVWCVKMLPSKRRSFALTFLAISDQDTRDARKLLNNESVVQEFTPLDRAFTLRLVEERMGLVTAYMAMDSMLSLLKSHV